ncbi:MAG: hypothetical protein QM736_28850 [Vicinamibacterales bacterium]
MTVGRTAGVVRPSTDKLVYEVDSAAHRIVVRYTDGRIAFAFGGYGCCAGEFDTPLDVATIWPEFSGEPSVGPSAIDSLSAPWVAVADYGNHRVQFFECDGTWIGETQLDPAEPPCQLTWRAPALEIAMLDGRLVRVHVAAALLSTTRREQRHQPSAHSDRRGAWRVC